MESIKALAQICEPVPPDMAGAEVLERFWQSPELPAIAVVENERPVGLVSRAELLQRFADRFGPDLHGRRPISRLMDPRPLLVDAGVEVEVLNTMIVESRPEALTRGFIITEGDRYYGIASGIAVLQANMKLAADRSEELLRAKIAAETAARTKSMFLANMSHELRTPLNAIIGFTDFITEGTLGEIQPARYKEYIRDVNESGRHLLNVINAILDMSKIEAGHLDLDEEVADPLELADSVLRIVRGMAERAGVSLVNRLPAALPNMVLDPQLFRQMLMNLVSNAVKFSERGRSVWLEADQPADGSVLISVVDEGCGIAPEDMERVMMPFGQADISLGRNKGGTGLGLPLVKALAEAHQGRFHLKSELGKGTRAVICLPPERVLRDRPSALRTIA